MKRVIGCLFVFLFSFFLLSTHLALSATAAKSSSDSPFYLKGILFKSITGFSSDKMKTGLTVFFTDSAKNTTINDYDILHRSRWAMKQWNNFSPSPNFKEINDYDKADVTVHIVYDPNNYVAKMKPQDMNGVWYDTGDSLANAHKYWNTSKIWINKRELAANNKRYDRTHQLYFDYEDTKKMLVHEFGHVLSYDHQPYSFNSVMVVGQITTPEHKEVFNTPTLYDELNWSSRFK